MSAGPRLIDAPAPIATPSCSGTRCALRLAQTGPEEVSVRRNSWPRSRPHWCVRDCDAVSQQDLEEETGCGQADCSIMPGTCKLHGPASHCALAFLLDAALPSAGGNSPKYAKSMLFEGTKMLGALIMWFAGRDQHMQVHYRECCSMS